MEFSTCTNFDEFGKMVKQIVNKWSLRLKENDETYSQTKESVRRRNKK